MPEQTPAEELRELIREGHGLVKDIRTERRAVEQLLDGIPARVEASIKDTVERGLVALRETTKTAMDRSVAKVFAEFDRLQGLLTGTHPSHVRKGKPPLEDLIRAYAETKDDGHA
jgi:hypothetical protein